jgi:hypothetical protein
MSEIKLNYDISLQDYIDYNQTVFDLQLGSKAKRTTWQGIIISVLAVALLVVNAFFYKNELPYIIIGVLVFLAGIYCSLFYKVFAPKMLKKSVTCAFENDKNGFLNREVTLCDHYFSDEPSGAGEIEWETIGSVVETNTQFLIMFPDMRGVIIPKDKVDTTLVEQFLKEQTKNIEKDYFCVKEKGEDK